MKLNVGLKVTFHRAWLAGVFEYVVCWVIQIGEGESESDDVVRAPSATRTNHTDQQI